LYILWENWDLNACGYAFQREYVTRNWNPNALTAEAIRSTCPSGRRNGWREGDNSLFSNTTRENMLRTDLPGATTLSARVPCTDTVENVPEYTGNPGVDIVETVETTQKLSPSSHNSFASLQNGVLEVCLYRYPPGLDFAILVGGLRR
jgi:hypothetical protein